MITGLFGMAISVISFGMQTNYVGLVISRFVAGMMNGELHFSIQFRKDLPKLGFRVRKNSTRKHWDFTGSTELIRCYGRYSQLADSDNFIEHSGRDHRRDQLCRVSHVLRFPGQGLGRM